MTVTTAVVMDTNDTKATEHKSTRHKPAIQNIAPKPITNGSSETGTHHDPTKLIISQPIESAGSASEIIQINGIQLHFQAILDTHGWVTMENIRMPYLIRRGSQKMVPLCVVEKTFLVKYPGPYPEKQLGRAPMMGFYLTTEEVRLLNRFVNQTFTQRIGMGRFSLKDMLVTIVDFIDFYTKVRSLTPLTTAVVAPPRSNSPPKIQGGWAQVNNTVVPYVLRNRVKMVPLSVVKYAAGLLHDVEVPSLQANPDECFYLNDACDSVGLNFQFMSDTRLLELFLVPTLSNTRVGINELPRDDPLLHAKFTTRNNDRRSVFVAASVRAQELRKGAPGSANPIQTESEPDPNLLDRGLKQRRPPKNPSPPISIDKSLPKVSIVKTSTQVVPTKSVIASTKSVTAPTAPSTALQSNQVISSLKPLVQSPSLQILSPLPNVQSPPGQVVINPGTNYKICPQHGIRLVTTNTTTTPQPSPVILSPPIIQAGAPQLQMPFIAQAGITQQHRPIMLIRLDKPLSANGALPQFIVPPALIPQAGILPPGTIFTRVPVPVTGVPKQLAPNTPINQGSPIVIKEESDDEEGDRGTEPIILNSENDIESSKSNENKEPNKKSENIDADSNITEREALLKTYSEDGDDFMKQDIVYKSEPADNEEITENEEPAAKRARSESPLASLKEESSCESDSSDDELNDNDEK